MVPMAIDLWGLQGVIPIPLEPILTVPRPVIPVPPSMPVPPVIPYPFVPAPPIGSIPQGMEVPYLPPRDYMNDIDWENNPPASPEDLGDAWEEVTAPRNKSGSREFENKETGERIR